jgi:hypothetical protein
MKTTVIESIKTFKVVLLLFSFLISSCSRNVVESDDFYEPIQVDYGSVDLIFVKRVIENIVKQDLGCEYVIFQENDSSFNEQSHYKFVFGYAFELYYEKENTLLLEKEYEFLPPPAHWTIFPVGKNQNKYCVLEISKVMMSTDKTVFFLLLYIPSEDKYFPFLSIKDDNGEWKLHITGAL